MKEHHGTYNQGVLATAIIRYAKDHGGLLPPAETWCDELMAHDNTLTKSSFAHPDREGYNLSGACSYAFNSNLGGKRLSDIPDHVILLFEADGGWNLNGTGELLKTRYRKHGYIAVVFANKQMRDYWYEYKQIRCFDKYGRRMYYENPRWKP